MLGNLSYDGRHYYLKAKTGKELSGRGIRKTGEGEYRATENAYLKICEEHSVWYKAFLD